MTNDEWTKQYNDFYLSLTNHGKRLREIHDEAAYGAFIDVINECIVAWHVGVLKEAKRQYYLGIEGDFMSDATYDRFEDGLRAIRPNHEFFNKVGYDVKQAMEELI